MEKNLPILPAALLLIAVAPLPYGYYTFLRIAVTLCACTIGWMAYKERDQISAWVVIFGLVAILFNPLIPVYLTRDVWLVLDIGVAAIFLTWWYLRFS